MACTLRYNNLSSQALANCAAIISCCIDHNGNVAILNKMAPSEPTISN